MNLNPTDLVIYGVIAALLPALIAVINRPTFPSWAKQLVETVVALAAGVTSYGFTHNWNFGNTATLGATLGGIWAATQGFYLLFWQHALAPAIEQKVNAGKALETDPKAAV